MKRPVVKFDRKDRSEFFRELRKRVNQHMADNRLSRYANLNMKLKTAFMLSLYTIPLILLVSGFVRSFYPMMGMWILMGFGMSGIGLSIMHDANHGSYSKKTWVNKFFGYLSNYVGAYHINWKIQHNVLHHSFTNIHGFDEDIEVGVMRFSPDQEHKGIFRFQAFYAPFLYGLMTLYWLLVKDFKDLVSYEKRKLLVSQGITFSKALSEIIFNKIWYIALTLVLPMIIVPLPWFQVLLGFLLMQFISGVVLALIFQPAHVLHETDFVVPNDEGNVENNWAIHQLMTTSNFAHGSVLFSWFIGGLNYQIEHHLFPKICHVHYKGISKIVKETAKEFGIPYHQHKTFFDALKSHFSFLHQLGTGSYDRKLLKA